MKDFSLLYGPARAWLPVLAIAVVAAVLVFSQGSDDATSCPDGAASVGCGSPPPGERRLLVAETDGGLLSTSTEPGGAETSDADIDPWAPARQSDREVPVVSLEPSPEPMTDAGRDLVRSAGSGGGG